jgi:diguanylate cyclase (GGDEF)-like protein
MTDFQGIDHLRTRVAALLEQRRDALAPDVDAALVPRLPSGITARARARMALKVVELLAAGLDVTRLREHPALGELATVEEAAGGLAGAFAAIHAAEQAILDELALDDELGARSESWSGLEQLLRGAAFAVLAAYCERRRAAFIDPLSGLVSRQAFEAALGKELERAVRRRRPLAVILFDIDRFSDINKMYGRGVGDRVIERLGVFLQKYFRVPDWVARCGGDSVAVLLAEIDAADAQKLADGARQTIEKRLAFGDRRDRPVRLTVSAAVVTLTFKGRASKTPVSLDVQRVIAEAEGGLALAKANGGNRLERVEVIRPSLSITAAAHLLGCSTARVRQMIAERALTGFEERGKLRADLDAVSAYARRLSASRAGEKRRTAAGRSTRATR